MPSHQRRASAPGRVTLIGEHTDYNAGLSIGCALRWRTRVEVVRGGTGIRVVSQQLGVANPQDPGAPGFALAAGELARLAGCADAEVRVDSDLPVGAGLSSSAAYCVAVALALGLEGSAFEVAVMCQRAERAAGADVGLLDQLVALGASEGHGVLIDFSRSALESVRIDARIGLSLVDTGVRRELANSSYATRRSECAQASAVLGTALGTASISQLSAIGDPVLASRARHVVTECDRVRSARVALEHGQLERFADILDASHASLRDDFEVTSPAVDRAYEQIRSAPHVLGARLVGGGFGGWVLCAHDPGLEIEVSDREVLRVEPGGAARLEP